MKMKFLALILKSFIVCLFVIAIVRLIAFLTHVDDLETRLITSGNVVLILVAVWGLYQSWNRSRGLLWLNVGVLVINGVLLWTNVVGLA
ncbi:hypothetical protein QFZ77_000002 [Paenibacillus sp. V4I3]|uniref:hypothetical protein n=1 Tax=Paenibacillus sp. V4I3 TaxID=3042305 RepID=UPI002783FCA4|nr:hypothetical protein [Paenibacillus sp. V4I3]MDQ0871343.1 hypothetical protein [Paenibacillus sp. V4I3]